MLTGGRPFSFAIGTISVETKKGQRFEFDERFAVVEFATPGSVRVSVYESRLVPLESKRSKFFARLKHNPHVGFVDIHYPTDGGRPVFVRMDLEERWCNLDDANSLYVVLAKELQIPNDAPYEIQVSEKAQTTVGVHGDSRFCEICGYRNRDSFDVPNGFWEEMEKRVAQRRLERSDSEQSHAPESTAGPDTNDKEQSPPAS